MKRDEAASVDKDRRLAGNGHLPLAADLQPEMGDFVRARGKIQGVLQHLDQVRHTVFLKFFRMESIFGLRLPAM